MARDADASRALFISLGATVTAPTEGAEDLDESGERVLTRQLENGGAGAVRRVIEPCHVWWLRWYRGGGCCGQGDGGGVGRGRGRG